MKHHDTMPSQPAHAATKFRLRPTILRFIAAAALGASVAQAADDSLLLEILEKNGTITSKQAAAVRKQLAEEKAAPIDASKIKLTQSLTELKLYGDIRLRYQYDNRDPQLAPPQVGDDEDRSPTGNQQSRWRFRLRIGAEFQLGKNWFGGFELGTGQASDTNNQTFENGFDDYAIFINRAYFGWHDEVFSITGGKMPNPFYTSELVWDSDITPNGFAEGIKFHELFASKAESGYDKDGKSVVTEKKKSPWELSLVAGQFIFDDNAENSFDNDESNDAYLFQTQLVGSYAFSKDVKLVIAPGWLVYNAASVTGATNSAPFNDSPNVSGATRNINLLLAPGQLDFRLAGIKSKFIWDFAYNIEGRKRAEDIYNLVTLQNANDPDDFRKQHDKEDDIAFLAGFQLGETKKAGDWSWLSYYRQAGVSSLDPNLNDSDFASSRLNTRGFKNSIAYSFTDFAIATVSYQYAWNLKDNLIGGEATGGAGIADGNVIHVFQVDLMVRF
jgi:hypothetical protein